MAAGFFYMFDSDVMPTLMPILLKTTYFKLPGGVFLRRINA